MKRILFIGHGQGAAALEEAWDYVYEEKMPRIQRENFLNHDQGSIVHIGQKMNQDVYWVAVSHSFSICRQAWNDLIPLLGDSILNWKFIEK